MATTLFLVEARAARDYTCPACNRPIPRGALHFRHDPHPGARARRGELRSHWCHDCITHTPSLRDSIGRLWIRPARLVRAFAERRGVQLELFRARVVGIGR